MMAPASAVTERPEGGWARQDWMASGACHGLTSIFFAPHAERPQARVRREALARSICQECPVIDPCRDHARVQGEYGFWGGESEDDRAIAGYAVPWPAGAGRRRALAVAG
ncbi:MAG: WhiB family transcriptional regulator [Acidimicrobiales bacterium]